MVMKHQAGAEVARKRCSHEGCANHAVRGVCIRHGADVKICNHEGCTNKAFMGGACRRYGERCSHDGCTNNAKKKGSVRSKWCSHEKCTILAVSVLSMGQRRQSAEHASVGDAPTVPRKEEFAIDMEQSAKDAAGCTNQAYKGVSVLFTWSKGA